MTEDIWRTYIWDRARTRRISAEFRWAEDPRTRPNANSALSAIPFLFRTAFAVEVDVAAPHHLRSAASPGPDAVRVFFEELVLPRLDRLIPADRTPGSIAFAIADEAPRTYVVHFHPPLLCEGDDDDARARVLLSKEDLAGLLRGSIDVTKAIQSQRVKFFGDPKMLHRLATLLERPLP